MYTQDVQELVAIGAAIAANCEPCFRFHFDKARKLGVAKVDIAHAVATAKMVKESPARSILALAEKYLKDEAVREEQGSSCCAAEPASAR